MRGVFTLTTLACAAALAVASSANAAGGGKRCHAMPAAPRGDGPGEINAANGKHNRGIVETNSPVIQRGTQHTSTETLGGVTNVQSAFCRNVRICHITLQVVVPAAKKHKVTTTQEIARQEDGEPDGAAATQDEGCCCAD
ncbi:hypothetical protein GCM10009677_04040 [Sphaerisporangium rubeum]|uniref:Uncharacterized protein n=1 Tax=Sphaerisporangium rubeum TaxID=321317 RepID=A0A7X0I944_9ACTN|nr:hypothetical protein [Sphaerisporangium rubeum]MBB6470753.1 hypothetical protein [Sphaerisporangium rubeum]